MEKKQEKKDSSRVIEETSKGVLADGSPWYEGE